MTEEPVPQRIRVDLAARRVRLDRPMRELEEQTQVGEVLVRGLIRTQLGLAVRLSVVVIVLLGGLPVLFALVPGLGDVGVFGLRLPWLLLGVLAYPLLYVVARIYVRQAERNEQDFADFVNGS